MLPFTLLNKTHNNTNNSLVSNVLNTIFRPLKSQEGNLSNVLTISNLFARTINNMRNLICLKEINILQYD